MKKLGWMRLTSYCSPAILAIVAAACATNIPKVKTYDEAAKEVDARGALISPPIEQREGYEEGTSTRLDQGKAAPYNGNLIDDKKSMFYVAIKAERDRRRAELEAATRKAEIQKIIYESAIENLKAQAMAKGTWWEQNKGLVGFGIGSIVGMAVIVGVMYALTGGKSIEVKTSPLLMLSR